MTKLQTGLTATAITAALSFTTLAESNAAPIFVPKTATAQSDVIQVGGARWRRGYRYNNGWYPAGAFIAGALIGGAIGNNGYYGNSYYGNSYYGNSYYGNGYYANRYYPRGYYQQRAYYPSRSAYRQGYADGYRAGFNDAVGGGIPCTSRLQAAGRC